MKKRYNITTLVILVLFLIVAYFISRSIMKGILLLLLSGVLVFNTILKLKTKKEDKFREKIFLGILLFLNSVLLLGSVYIIVSAIVET